MALIYGEGECALSTASASQWCSAAERAPGGDGQYLDGSPVLEQRFAPSSRTLRVRCSSSVNLRAEARLYAGLCRPYSGTRRAVPCGRGRLELTGGRQLMI